jgi:hypothetical protein
MKGIDHHNIPHFYAVLRTTVTQVLQGPRAHETSSAIVDEIKNMLSYRVGHYVKWSDIPAHLKGNALYSFMFVKDKTRPDGSFERVKARMVCNGANQKYHMFELISSATVGLTSVFIILNFASHFSTSLPSPTSSTSRAHSFMLSSLHKTKSCTLRSAEIWPASE